MRTLTTRFTALLTALFVTVPCLLLVAQGWGANEAAPRVPRSLEALYPPQADQPVYLFGMLEMDSYFSGIAADLTEGDLAGARGNFEEFRKQYAKARKVVPEWAAYYAERPVQELASAFDSHDRGRVMQAFSEMGKTCHQCHVSTMAHVQQRFRWGDFARVSVKDPLTSETVDFARFKKMLATNLTGVGVNLRQGQPENALRQFEGFKARFEGLRQSCQSCHDRDPRYYVDEEAQARVEALGRALTDRASSPEKLTALLQEIGRESCSKCHLVHVPAALAKTAGR